MALRVVELVGQLARGALGHVAGKAVAGAALTGSVGVRIEANRTVVEALPLVMIQT